MSEIQVIKRDGIKEPLDLEKMHKVVMFACEDIAGVSASEVELKSHIQFYDGIKSEEIQETLIKAAADLISEETPNYQWVAGNLVNYHLRTILPRVCSMVPSLAEILVTSAPRVSKVVRRNPSGNL